MPTKPLGNQSVNKPKTNEDVLRELLNPLQSNALKTVQKIQKEQITEAMQQGVPAEHILKQLGINTETPSVNMGSVNSTKTNPQTQTQFLPAQGMFSPAQQLPTGQIQEGGALSWIGGNSTSDLLKKMVVMSQIQKNQMGGMSPIEQESYQLNNSLKKLQIAQIQNTGEIPTSEELLQNIPQEEQEDYIIKPVKQTIRGMVNTVPILERKKTLPAKQLEDLASFENTQQDLNAVMNRLTQSGLQLGPGFSTRPGAISDMLGQTKGSEFAAMKADIGRNFQLYRKNITGVAAGYPELNMLAPNYPKATDTNEVFIQKSIDVMKDIQRNREIMLDHFNKGGYAVSKLRNSSATQEQTSQSSLLPDKAKRLEELRRKKAEGTLGR